MPFENHWSERGLYRTYKGYISGKQILQQNLELQGHPNFDSLRYVINDLTLVEDFDISEKDIETITVIDNVAAISNSKIKVAVIAVREDILKWARLYCEMAKNTPFLCAVFSDVDQAKKWAEEPF